MLETIKYADYEEGLPQEGKHILGQEKGEHIIVYQAFNLNISAYALTHQKFGGSHYRFSRMSWIKPNFLWMMYRSNWASKEHQQKILAITIPKTFFLEILSEAVHSSFIEEIYGTKENWKAKLKTSEVRLQWDPDHKPNGEKHTRKAIQLGLRGSVLQRYSTEAIISIEDITPFVHKQKQLLTSGHKNDLEVIKEKVISVENKEIIKSIILD